MLSISLSPDLPLVVRKLKEGRSPEGLFASKWEHNSLSKEEIRVITKIINNKAEILKADPGDWW